MIIKVLNEKIRDEYASIRNFCKEEDISLSVFNSIGKKSNNHFQAGSKAFKAYKKLKKMNFIEIVEVVA